MVPAEEVTEISWGLQETLQAIVSGGITVPESVEYTIGVMDPDAVKKSLKPKVVKLDSEEESTDSQKKEVEPTDESRSDSDKPSKDDE